MSVEAIVMEHKHGRVRWVALEEPNNMFKIVRYASDNTLIGTSIVPRELFVAFARTLIAEKVNAFLGDLR